MNSALLTSWTHTVRIKPYNANVDDNNNFYQFVLFICNHFLKEKKCPKFMITLFRQIKHKFCTLSRVSCEQPPQNLKNIVLQSSKG